MATTPKTTTSKTPTTRKTTTSTKTSTRSSTAASTTASTTPAPPKVEPVVVAEAEAVVSGPELKKSELIDAVVERSGIKKRFAKPSIEAALAVLGEALEEGRTLNLMPMGKAKVQKSKDISGGRVLSLRLRQRQRAAEETSSETVAEPAE